MSDTAQHTDFPFGHALLSAAAGVDLPAASLKDLSLLDIGDVAAIVKASPHTIRGWVRAKTFPAPVRISARCSRWNVGSVKQWLTAKLYEAPATTEPHAGAKRASDAALAKRRAVTPETVQ